MNGKKICGILTESSVKGEIVENLIIGIGFNVNQSEFKGNIKDTATSLKKEFGKTFSREEILSEFLNEFEEEYLKTCFISINKIWTKFLKTVVNFYDNWYTIYWIKTSQERMVNNNGKSRK